MHQFVLCPRHTMYFKHTEIVTKRYVLKSRAWGNDEKLISIYDDETISNKLARAHARLLQTFETCIATLLAVFLNISMTVSSTHSSVAQNCNMLFKRIYKEPVDCAGNWILVSDIRSDPLYLRYQTNTCCTGQLRGLKAFRLGGSTMNELHANWNKTICT